MKVAIIIPTYNEKDNIEKFIRGILSLNVKNLHIIVVDDNSPDGTGILVEKIKLKDNRIHIINRKRKMGLGTAYLDGFKYALEKGADIFFEIDADFSHDHTLIPKFIENIEKNDLVVGSRYIPNGKIKNWDYSRRLLSLFGNLYARMILRIPVKDLTTGYKCYRKNVIQHLINKNINSIGYVFQIETTYYTYKNNFSIKEIPIVFSGRIIGESKMNSGIILESFWKVLKLRLKNDSWKK